MKKVITSILVVCYILALVPAIIVAVTTEQELLGTVHGNGPERYLQSAEMEKWVITVAVVHGAIK